MHRFLFSQTRMFAGRQKSLFSSGLRGAPTLSLAAGAGAGTGVRLISYVGLSSRRTLWGCRCCGRSKAFMFQSFFISLSPPRQHHSSHAGEKRLFTPERLSLLSDSAILHFSALRDVRVRFRCSCDNSGLQLSGCLRKDLWTGHSSSPPRPPGLPQLQLPLLLLPLARFCPRRLRQTRAR